MESTLPKSIKTAQKLQGDIPSFVCENETYYVYNETMSSERTEEFLKLAPHLSISMELLDVHTLLLNVYQDLSNIQRLGDVINITNRVGNVLLETKDKTAGQLSQDQVAVVWRLCALFIVRKSEDLTTIDEALFTEKINAWRRNMDFLSFFQLARKLSLLFKRPSEKEYPTQ